MTACLSVRVRAHVRVWVRAQDGDGVSVPISVHDVQYLGFVDCADLVVAALTTPAALAEPRRGLLGRLRQLFREDRSGVRWGPSLAASRRCGVGLRGCWSQPRGDRSQCCCCGCCRHCCWCCRSGLSGTSSTTGTAAGTGGGGEAARRWGEGCGSKRSRERASACFGRIDWKCEAHLDTTGKKS